MMMPGSYTELFFLDEATALAAGHRPCAQCRGSDYRAFLTAWRKAGLPLPGKGSIANAIDARLEGERRATSRPRLPLDELPRGTIVGVEGGELALVEEDGCLPRWGFRGCTREPDGAAGRGVLAVMTPMSIVEVLQAGCWPAAHPPVGARS